jgi:hypothetical protein
LFSTEGVLVLRNVFTGIVFCFINLLTLCKKKASKNLTKNVKLISHFAVGENTNRGDPPLPVFSPATFAL